MDPQKRPGELIQELVEEIKEEDFSKRSQGLTLKHHIQRTMKKIGGWDDFFIAEEFGSIGLAPGEPVQIGHIELFGLSGFLKQVQKSFSLVLR